MIELEARVIKRVWHNDSFYIYAVEPTSYTDKVQMNKYGNVSITGDIGFLVEGEIYEFILADGKKNQYGVSYPVDDVPSVRLETLGEMSYAEKFGILMNCTSSERLASNILSSYPNFIELVLTEGKEAIDTNKVKGMGDVYLNAYVRELTKMFKYYSLCKHETLKPYNISQKDAKALYDIYSNQEAILRAFKDNPYYCLIEICGRKFDSVDKIIVETRNDLIDSFQRTEALIIDVLRLNEYEGSTRLNGGVLYRVVKEDYTNCKNLIPKLKDVAVESQYIYFDEDSGDLSVLDTYVAECNIAQFVKEKNETNNELDFDVELFRTMDNGISLTDEHMLAVENFKKHNLSFINSRAGSGKSTIAKALVDVCNYLGLSATILAPSGSASMRIADTTKHEATTIHLKCLRDMTINSDVLIVDECSMIDLPTFNMMINCINNEKIRIVLIGDVQQIQPVGVGSPFSDLVLSNNFTVATFTKVFRYGNSGIAYATENIRSGRLFLDDDVVDKTDAETIKIKDDWDFITRSSDEDIAEEILNQYRKLIKNGINKKDILVCTAYNVGNCGTYILNDEIQSEFNQIVPEKTPMSRNISNFKKINFKKNDIVINKKNNYKAITLETYERIKESNGILTKEDVETFPIFNGQRGVVLDSTKDALTVKFDNQIIVLDRQESQNVLLGMAQTMHSAQGQEAKYVICCISENQSRLLNKNLLYVANSRARVKHINIGSLKAFNQAILTDGLEQRNTWLKELIIKN